MEKRVSIFRAGMSGLIVGATMIIPGVSGGSMAMILGIYDCLIHAVSSLEEVKKQIWFLLAFITGAGSGMLVFSGPMLWLLEKHPLPVSCFFMGAVLGAVPMIVRKSGKKLWKGESPIWVMAGILGVLLLAMIPTDIFQTEGQNSIRYQAALLLVGIPAAGAAVLPGISVSHFFLIFGLYDDLIRGIQCVNLRVLVSLGSGVLLGMILTVRGLEYVLQKYPGPAYLIILGFILGSLGELYQGSPTGLEWLICSLCAGVGFWIIKKLADGES